MLRIGCDFHPGFPQVAIFDKERGEISCRRLQHPEEARAFYGLLPEPALVGVEACVRTMRKGNNAIETFAATANPAPSI